MTRLEQQLTFLLEIDKLKHVMRRTRLLTGGEGVGRFENTAEHSWHIALMAVVLAEHANEPVDVGRVVKMLLVHDLVEIDAGDTPAYGDQADKEELEAAAAERIFGLLPEDQGGEFRELWMEFEARETAESRFANAIDRILPTYQNLHNAGGSWLDFSVTRERVEARLTPIGEGSSAVWEVVRKLLDEADATGYFKGGKTD
jgi:putative hydrolase of HD superfamily